MIARVCMVWLWRKPGIASLVEVIKERGRGLGAVLSALLLLFPALLFVLWICGSGLDAKVDSLFEVHGWRGTTVDLLRIEMKVGPGRVAGFWAMLASSAIPLAV